MAAVQDPWEVWLVPFRKKDGSVVLRKRYIGLFIRGERSAATLTVVERMQEGWVFWTGHRRETLDSQRNGYLLQAREG